MYFEHNMHCNVLYRGLVSSCTELQASWLNNALYDIATSGTALAMHMVYSAMARRKLGNTPVVLDSSVEQNIGYSWFSSDAARTLLLEQLIIQPDDNNNREQLINNAFQSGDEYERGAILKGLCLLDSDGEMSTLSIHSGRTNSYRLFSAIALMNPYAGQHYNERAFNQLVLKALFMDLDIRHIMGLAQRKSQKLNSMCTDYVRERLAANRSLPNFISYAIDFSLLDDDEKKLFSRSRSSTTPDINNHEPVC